MRIEVDEMGRHILILPEEVIEEFQLEDGDRVQYSIEEGLMVIDFE